MIIVYLDILRQDRQNRYVKLNGKSECKTVFSREIKKIKGIFKQFKIKIIRSSIALS